MGYHVRAHLLDPVQRHDIIAGVFVAQERPGKLLRPSAYILSTVNVNRLELQSLTMPMLHLLLPLHNPQMMVIIAAHPWHSPLLEDKDGEAECVKAKEQGWSAISGALPGCCARLQGLSLHHTPGA